MILDTIAASGTQGSALPRIRALIDTGALITGMSNEEVAWYLLTKGGEGANAGLLHCDGVVFLDDADRKMVLVREGLKVQRLEQSGVRATRRFAFYDQIHTTGMDIKHALNAEAVLTLGKGMVWRDYAQGAYRMRGIGVGQTIRLFVPPEILSLIQTAVAMGEGTHPADVRRRQEMLPSGAARTRQLLCDVAAWQVSKAMETEHVQWTLLMQQSANNVWRKRALELLKQYHTRVGLTLPPTAAAARQKVAIQLQDAVDIYRSRIDYAVGNAVPRAVGFAARIAAICAEPAHLKFIAGDREAETQVRLRQLISFCLFVCCILFVYSSIIFLLLAVLTGAGDYRSRAQRRGGASRGGRRERGGRRGAAARAARRRRLQPARR